MKHQVSIVWSDQYPDPTVTYESFVGDERASCVVVMEALPPSWVRNAQDEHRVTIPRLF